MKTTLAGFMCASVLFVGHAATAQTAPSRPADTSDRIEAQVVGLPNQPAPPRTEAELKAEIGAQPQSFRAYAELAQLYRSNNRLDEADAVLRSALGQVQITDVVYGMLANLDRRSTNPRKSSQSLRNATCRSRRAAADDDRDGAHRTGEAAEGFAQRSADAS